MQFAAGVPNRWIVTLRSGAVLEIAADAYGRTDGQLRFLVLVDATPDEREQVLVEWDFPGDLNRFGMLVATVPEVEVVDIYTASSWFERDAGTT